MGWSKTNESSDFGGKMTLSNTEWIISLIIATPFTIFLIAIVENMKFIAWLSAIFFSLFIIILIIAYTDFKSKVQSR